MKMLLSQCLAVLCGISLVQVQAGVALQSGPQRSAGVTVLVNSVRNQSGHWISQVTLDHDNSRKPQTPSWTGTLEIEPSTLGCSHYSKSSYAMAFKFITPPSPTQAPGYELIPDVGSYKFHIDVATWERAREVCEQEGAHLLILNSEEESKAVMKLFAQHPDIPDASNKDYAWIGLVEQGANNKYFTIFGQPLAETGFSRWHPGEPHEKTVGDEMLVGRKSGGLADVPAATTWKMAYICEQELSC